jgi:hypothetical protein
MGAIETSPAMSETSSHVFAASNGATWQQSGDQTGAWVSTG